ncbi:hypothetical protein HUT18_09310 [Streptomyces sp. NA04227]|uniref:hypothetical protein n=1 Tax=Streptomyces sp. NA04227 TaxID=2742136 RepID=UPI0015913795|nr:hypothetical protein [Streptomyces sp. NA04227]QKW06569.1 hypothetical protein HUT18_09310 [Streptomyces sp. NA04227]
MRVRTTLGAAAGAAALLLALPTSASAADGDFSYVYTDSAGERQTQTLEDPPNEECITLAEAASNDVKAAHTPRNDTDAKATVYSEPNCQGRHFELRPEGGHASERLEVRSVVFS